MEPADNSVSYEAKGTGDSRVSYKTMKLQTVGCPTKLWNYETSHTADCLDTNQNKHLPTNKHFSI